MAKDKNRYASHIKIKYTNNGLHLVKQKSWPTSFLYGASSMASTSKSSAMVLFGSPGKIWKQNRYIYNIQISYYSRNPL